jgi:hypothetical protein
MVQYNSDGQEPKFFLMVPAYNGPIYGGIYTNTWSLFPSPNFPIVIVPTQIAWF